MSDMPNHEPPMFLVKQPREVTIDDTILHTETYHEFAHGEQDKALAKARELAVANPGQVIDIYQHVTGVRKSE